MPLFHMYMVPWCSLQSRHQAVFIYKGKVKQHILRSSGFLQMRSFNWNHKTCISYMKCPTKKPWSSYKSNVIHFFTMTGWWFGPLFIFHNIWDNHSHWLSYFSRWLKPPTRFMLTGCSILTRPAIGGYPPIYGPPTPRPRVERHEAG